jgi:uncharacterized protein (DUF58 family)
MILPASRLLLWSALTGVPLLAVAGAIPGARPVVTPLLFTLLTIALADALLSRGRLQEIEVELPALVRLTETRRSTIPVGLRMPASGRPPRLRFALAPLAALQPELDEVWVDLPEGSENARFPWSLLPLRRGSYRPESCFLECASRLGLWDVRRRAPVASELRVYPNLLGDRRQVAAVLLRRGGLGVHAHRHVGKGRELEQLRDYVPGDGFDDIHWRATAKRGEPITKVYQMERTQEVYAVVDCSRLAARLHNGEPALEGYLRAALVLALATRRFGDLYGQVLFDDRVRGFLRARAGRDHFGSCRDALYAQRTRPVAPDFFELSSFLSVRLRRRALLVLLTDLDDPAHAEGFTEAARMLSRRHLVQVIMLRPPQAQPLFSTGVNSGDEIYIRLAGHLAWHRLQELTRLLQRLGVALSLVDHSALVAEVVSRYIAVKRRQRL